MRIHKYLLYVSIFLLPINLGKHFVIRESYANGRLIDYLIPTVFLAEILIFLTVVAWLLSIKSPLKHFWKVVSSDIRLSLLVLFLVSMLLSVFLAPLTTPAIYFFAKMLLYFVFCVYLFDTFDIKNDFVIITRLLAVQVILLSLLAFAQWIGQKSLFDNYLYFGEQPYGYSTPNILKEDFFGVARIPPYSLFRHPNVFGGYLSIVLVWLLYSIRKDKSYRFLFLMAIFMGLVSIFLTLSYMSWLSLALGVLLLFVLEKWNVTFRKVLFLASAVAFLAGFMLLFINKFPVVSLQRRADLMGLNYQMFITKPLFGVGVNNSTALIEKYQVADNMSRFPQPVHNIFMLILSEYGFISALLFVGFLISLSLKKGKFYLLGITLFQIVLLGSFDHYLLTAHQSSLLMWLTFGASLIQFY